LGCQSDYDPTPAKEKTIIGKKEVPRRYAKENNKREGKGIAVARSWP
jgi:hypothetical protein